MKRFFKYFLPRRFLNHRREITLRSKYNIPQSTFISDELNISGNHFSCGEGCKFLGSIEVEGKVSIGRFTSVNGPNTDILSAIHPITIGSFCSVARNVSFQEFDHRFQRPTSYFINHNIFGLKRDSDITSKGAILLGNDVWIGAHSVILSGAKIGHGAIIAANSVVKGEVPPYAIVGGVPSKIIKYRFSDQTIVKLLEMEWWNWPLDRIKREHLFFNTELK